LVFHECQEQHALLRGCVDKSIGLRCDQTIRLNFEHGRKAYRKPLHRIRYRRCGHLDQSLVFVTKNLDLPALTVARIYQPTLGYRFVPSRDQATPPTTRILLAASQRCRGPQVWSAIYAYLLVAITHQRLGLPETLHQIPQVISISVLEKTPLHQLFEKNDTTNAPFEAGIHFKINDFRSNTRGLNPNKLRR
jgi:hypothetical protein